MPVAAPDAATTLVWIAPSPPDARQARTIASWEHARGVRLIPPRNDAPPHILVDLTVADDVEKLIDRARDALSMRDGEAADRALHAAASTLAAHAELPQSAWLLAEVERLRSGRLRRMAPVDDIAAAAAWARADALDGGRVGGLGEPAFTTTAAPHATVSWSQSAPDAVLFLDGSAVKTSPVSVVAGPHALVLLLDGWPVWSTWVDVPAGAETAEIIPPIGAPCSMTELKNVGLAATGLSAPGVRCTAWIAAAPAISADGVRFAVCTGERCGPWVDWPAPLPWTYQPPRVQDGAPGWPGWATWGAVGVGAVVAGGLVVLASGIFKTTPSETQFVGGGLRTQSASR